MDIPVDARPQILSGKEKIIVSKFEIPSPSQINIGNLSSSDITWEVEVTADIESGSVATPLAFKDELQRSP